MTGNPAAHEVLAERTLAEFTFDVQRMTVLDQNGETQPATDQYSVFMRCAQCSEVFVRPLCQRGAPHACQPVWDDATNKPKTLTVYRDHPGAPPRMEYMRVHEKARVPLRTRVTDAGYDVFSVENAVVQPHDMVNISTGLILVAPAGYYYTVEGRSSLWSRKVAPYRGLIDGGYTGVLHAALVNTSVRPYTILVGHKIAQVTLHEIIGFDMAEVDQISPPYVIRGQKGFGSSGS